MKTWVYRNREYTIISRGHGYYNLNGYHFTDSTVFDNVDSDDLKKRRQARRSAEIFVTNKLSA